MIAEVTDQGIDCEIRLAEMIVSARYVDENVQPWGGASCFRYHVRISAADGGEFAQYAYGSQVDFEQGRNDRAEELAWMVLDDLWSACNDPEEFFEMAISEPDRVDLERVRGVLSVIDYAEKISRVLDINSSDIEEARDR
jgi:hypothetical protein